MTSQDLFNSIEAGDLAGVDRTLTSEPLAIQARTAEGLTPIMVAAYWGQAEVLDRLLEVGADLDFWEAATVGATNRVSQLVNDQPQLVQSRSADGFTALHLAVFFGHPDTARVLIDAGSDVSARTTNAFDNQPLHAAAASSAAKSRLACVHLLLEAGAPVNERQSGGFTPLMSAAQKGDTPVAELLLAAGADAGLNDDQGQSAVDHAVNAGHTDLAAKMRTFMR
jgi:uncharacterized protein